MQQGTLQENGNARKVVSLLKVLENKGRKKGCGFRSLHLAYKEEDGQNKQGKTDKIFLFNQRPLSLRPVFQMAI